MQGDASEIVLTGQDLREVTGFAAACAQTVLELFETGRPDDPRPRDAIAAAWDFAGGGERGKALRDTAWAALKAAGDAETAAAREAARAAMAAAGAAYLHPLARATQVKHILGAAAHAARAAELAVGAAGVPGPAGVAGYAPDTGAEHIRQAARRATPAVVEVLERFPGAPQGGGRVGELTRLLDARLRRHPLA